MYERTYHRQVLKTAQDDEAPVRRSAPWKRILFFVLLIGALVGSGVAIRHPKLQITTIRVEGTEVLDPEEVRLYVVSLLQGRVAWLFPRSSTLLVQTEKIELFVKDDFPRIRSIRVERDGTEGLIVSVTEYKGSFLWCETKDTCFFMDQQGMVYSPAPVFSGTAYAKIISGAPRQELPFQGLSVESLAFVSTLEQGFTTIDITPQVFRFISPREVRIDFLHNKDSAEFIVDPTIPAETSLTYLLSGIRTAPLSTLFNDPEKKLLYIDVRFPNNIVYKFE